MPRHTYSYGYKTRRAAEDALDDMIAESVISESEDPRVESYRCAAGTRWRITLPYYG